jgi:GNAT superfamily N-acetyltransferase
MTGVIEIRPRVSGPDIAALLQACSPESLRRRFTLGGEPDPREIYDRYLRYLLAGPPDGVALLAVIDGAPAGLLNLVAEAPGSAEAGVLVADPWQRQGVARALTAWVRESERWSGWTVRATIQSDNSAAAALVRSQGFRPVPTFERGELDFELPVPRIMTDVMKEAADGEDAARANGLQRRAAGPHARCQRHRPAGRSRARRSAPGLPATLLPGR